MESNRKKQRITLTCLNLQGAPRLWREISKVQEELRAIDQRQLFAKPSTFHITVKVLRTFDKVANQQELEVLLARLQKIISEFPTFQITLRGLSFFPTSIYVKVEDEFDQLRMINKRIISEFGNLVDKGEYDGDSYIPHLTIATFNTKEAEDLISKVKSKELQEIEIGRASIFELEAVEARMYLLLGPEDTQDQGFRNLRTLQLMGGRNR